MKRRVWQSLIAIDQFLNAAVCNGWADETISSRAYRMQNRKKSWRYARIIIDIIFFFDKDHCRSSYYSEKMRQHLPPEIRDCDPRIN